MSSWSTALQTMAMAPELNRSYAGSKALWVKVIIRAVFDWVSWRDNPKFEKRKIAEQAEFWLFQPSELFNSFSNICDQLDLPKEQIQAWARSVTKEQVTKMEHLDRSTSSRGRTSLELKMAEMYWVQPQPRERDEFEDI